MFCPNCGAYLNDGARGLGELEARPDDLGVVPDEESALGQEVGYVGEAGVGYFTVTIYQELRGVAPFKRIFGYTLLG